MSTKARPFIKMAGGKTQLLPELLARVPKKFGTYHEPFLGGGALFFELSSLNPDLRAVLSDSNRRLIRTWQGVESQVQAVIGRLEGHAIEHCKKYYYEMREKGKGGAIDKATNADLAAWFIYMNKTCFNGLYRVNSKGEFNVPMGSYKNPTICDAENLLACSAALRHAIIKHEDFTMTASADRNPGRVESHDFVYFDPPYVPISKDSHFTSYTKESFTEADQEELSQVARRLKHDGAHVLLSNSSAPLVKKLYKGWKLEPVQAKRAINSKGGKRGEIKEYLIS